MAALPWTVVKQRRQTSTPASSSRKRQRKESGIRQQTLTQAQWVTTAPPSFIDGPDLTPIQGMPLHVAKPRLLKKDSTLTQMDFFNLDMADEGASDLTPLADIEHAQFDESPNQLDGIYETPRKPRKRKYTATLDAEALNKRIRESQGSRDYRPCSRMGKENITEEGDQGRRTSARIAHRRTIHPASAENFDFFREALLPEPAKPTAPVRKLEIQDSTVEDDDFENGASQPRPTTITSMSPITPRKRANIVASSQTPTSISPSSRKSKQADQTQTRSPLRERSTNTPTMLSAPLSNKDVPPSAKSFDEHIPTTSKLSTKRPNQRRPRVEDSQANVYSLPQTSSPEGHRADYLDHAKEAELPEVLEDRVVDPEGSFEVPPTSQIIQQAFNRPTVDNAERGAREPPLRLSQPWSAAVHNEMRQESRGNYQVNIRDFAEEEVLDQEPPEAYHVKFAVDQDLQHDEVENSDSEFGSPIKNDTQYNFGLEHRTSSRSRSPSQPSQPSNIDAGTHGTQGPESAFDIGKSVGPVGVENLNRPIPTPRLVTSPRPPSEGPTPQHEESSMDEPPLPDMPHQSTSITEVSTTRVPLNDTAPSSSPSMPVTKSTTQRSVHPASLPHPSQISTQEATQVYQGYSSIGPLDLPPPTSQSTPRITIKDSSSMEISLEDIPVYHGSQIHPDQGHGDGDDDVADGDEDEYDLDPPSRDRAVEEQCSLTTDTTSAARARERSSDVMPPPKLLAVAAQGGEGPEEPQSSSIESTDTPWGARSASIPPPTTEIIDQEEDSQLRPAEYLEENDELTPIPGFNNETQSDFTQNGHTTAAYVRRQWENGDLPRWYTPKQPHQVPGYTRR